MFSFISVPLILTAFSATTGLIGGSPGKPEFYCDMNALSAAERANLPKVLDELINASPTVRELGNGFELSFSKSKGLFAKATEWSSAESRCCPFFDFSLKVARFGGTMTIRITGPNGVKAFIAEDLPRLRRLMTNRRATQ